MSAPDRDTIGKVRLWISYAEDDLSVAVHIMELREHAPYRLAAYHAQQCVEKCLKAYLVYHSIDFPHTHRILYLLELCPGKDDWADTLTDAEELTPYAVTTRYPGEDEPVTETEAGRAISIATLVHTTILEALAWKDKGFRE